MQDASRRAIEQKLKGERELNHEDLLKVGPLQFRVVLEIMPPGFRPAIHLSLTDDHPYAQAFVIIEALPE